VADGEQGMPGHGGPWRRSAWLTAALTAVFVLAGFAALAVPLARAALHPPEAPSQTAASPRPQYVTCIHDGCDRITDSLRRLPLSQAEQTAAEATLHRVIADLPHGELQSSCGPPSQPISDRRESTRTGRCSSTYSPPTIDQVRRALVEAGYRDVVVRQPRADDLAPPGTVLIAVSVGPACVLAYTDGHSTPADVRGRLPNGRCLED
jgi:hypothetical protein